MPNAQRLGRVKYLNPQSAQMLLSLLLDLGKHRYCVDSGNAAKPDLTAIPPVITRGAPLCSWANASRCRDI
jgi:hypothetical protein